jgi:hypothetical protein
VADADADADDAVAELIPDCARPFTRPRITEFSMSMRTHYCGLVTEP